MRRVKTANESRDLGIGGFNLPQGRLETPNYRVANHVRFCRAGALTIFLDLKANTYFAIDRTQASLLRDVVVDWDDKGTSSASSPETSLANQTKVVQELLERGLLTSRTTRSKTVRHTDLDAPDCDLLDQYWLEQPSIRLRHVIQFAAACTSASFLLRTCSLNRIVQLLVRRKQGCVADDLDSEAVTELVTIYFALRPLLFQGKDACLLDSLALFDFLLRYGMKPTWVIGVMSGPFRAHSWLQQHGTVLNDRHRRVSSYTPILAV